MASIDFLNEVSNFSEFFVSLFNIFFIARENCFILLEENVNPCIHNVEKWPNTFLKSCGVHPARFLQYVRPFFNIMNERVKFIRVFFDANIAVLFIRTVVL